MSEQAIDAPAAPATPTVGAETERASLMGSADFRAKAMDPKSAEWQRLTELNQAIAGNKEAHAEAAPPQPGPQEDPEIPPSAFDPPARPEGYDQLQQLTHQAQQAGLEVDMQGEIDLRRGLHEAGVDQGLATMLYSVSINAARQDLTPVSVAAEHAKTTEALRRSWGSDYDTRVQMANAEGKRIFAALPDSVKDGMTYGEFCLVSGLANSRVAVEQLYMRAKARQAAKR